MRGIVACHQTNGVPLAEKLLEVPAKTSTFALAARSSLRVPFPRQVALGVAVISTAAWTFQAAAEPKKDDR
jgi:hypothetical protein